ncbi:MAG: hypothetical protein ACRDJN_14545 [Chloroflexota bacterium]
MADRVADEDLLYRRLSWAQVNPDGTVNSSAYKTPSRERRSRGEYDISISVELARLTTPEATLSHANRPGGGVGMLIARDPRRLGFEVRHDPLPDNDAHALIEGENNRGKSRQLAHMTKLLIAPQPPADL